MKLLLTIFFGILFQVNLYGIERYSKGDTLYNWATKLNLRETPNINSNIIAQILKNERVISNQNKYFKEEDFLINPNAKNWEKSMTGKWVEIIYQGKKGFVFDTYLSKYELDEIKNSESYIRKDTLRIPDFEVFYRLYKKNGIITEGGAGIEWNKGTYYIPDFSIEEAIYLVKENTIDNNFGNRKWKINLEKNEIEMNQKDELSYLNLKIIKVENLCIITIENGM